MRYRIITCVGLLCTVFAGSPCEADEGLREEAAQALRKATRFFRAEVSTESGYLWQYSEDLKYREGEGKANAQTVWVQPPGTPSVGTAFLRAFEATGDTYYLDAAVGAAQALVRGQLRSGGWDYRIVFDAAGRQKYAYRVERESTGGRNVTTLDDDVTQSALRFLMQVDRTLEFKDSRIHESVQYALSRLIEAQYPNGAWPQRYDHLPDPARFPVRKASYPESWSRTFPKRDYKHDYTFNDSAIQDMITTFLLAARVYGSPTYQAAAEKGGDFILLSQMPDPQPAWAQQYDADMHPSWARRFEPPSITGSESQSAMRCLLTLYRETGDGKWLEPLPQAIAYFRRSLLPDGRLARFYELKTNRPLYFTKTYELTYSDADMPTHYAFKAGNGIEAIAAECERLRKLDPAALRKLREQNENAPPKLTPKLANQARSVIAALDDRGRWVESGQMRYHGEHHPTRRIISCATFAKNLDILSRYLSATRAQPPRD